VPFFLSFGEIADRLAALWRRLRPRPAAPAEPAPDGTPPEPPLAGNDAATERRLAS